MISHSKNLNDLIKAFQAGLAPPEMIDLDAWSDKYRFINEVSGEKWMTKRVEIARGPMRAITEPGVRTVTVMCCTQLMKALDVATPIPSPDGRKTMGDLNVGDRVYDEKGKPCRVTAVTDVMRGKNCFRVEFSDGSFLLADEDHQWAVDDNMGENTSQKTRVINTLEMSKTFKNGHRNRYAIPVAKPVRGKKQTLPVPPYTLGAWLGDGHSYSSHITQHEKDFDVIRFVEGEGFVSKVKSRTDTGTLEVHVNTIESCGYSDKLCTRGHDPLDTGLTKQGHCAECSRQYAMKHKRGHKMDPVKKPKSLAYILTDTGLLKGASKRNLGNEKHIPEVYFHAPEKDRWSLLQGLMDTDGTIGKNGRSAFTSKSERISKDFERLVCSLGLKCVMKKSFLKDGYVYYHGTFTAYADQPVFRLPRKLSRLPSRRGGRPSETSRRRVVNVSPITSLPVKCITVDSPNSLYLAGDNYIPTHNTEFILNTVGYFMHLDPCPILVVQPKEEIAKKFSNVRLKQMIRSTPVLRGLTSDSKMRNSADTALYKEFPGGHVTIVSARSPSNLAMLPIRIVLLDEIDKYEDSSGSEGDPIDLAEERMATYSANSLSIRVCSPTTKNLSRIEASYLTSDMRKPFVACPHCEGRQVMLWPSVHWEKDEQGHALPETANYACTHCGVAWSEAERLRALKDIVWRQTAGFVCRTCQHDNKPSIWDPLDAARWNEHGQAVCEECEKGQGPNTHAGFWASKLYSPFRPLSELVHKWIEAQGNIEKLKAFINTQLAETFEEAGDQIEDVEWLMARREHYIGEVPVGVGLLTAGVDIQENRIELEVVGWGVDEESWSINYKVLPGDPSKSEVWDQLEEELNRAYYYADGRLTYVTAASIDLGGGQTQPTANFCRDKISRRFWPIRGMGGEGRPYPVWPKNPGRTSKINVPFYNVGVDAAKNTIFARLHIKKEGPGYSHFPLDRDNDWFKQLTAERRVLRYKGTQRFYRWENPRRARNEAFDCRVYAYASLCGLFSLGWSVNIITKEERLIMAPDFEQKRQEGLNKKSSGSSVEESSSSSGRVVKKHKTKRRGSALSSYMNT